MWKGARRGSARVILPLFHFRDSHSHPAQPASDNPAPWSANGLALLALERNPPSSYARLSRHKTCARQPFPPSFERIPQGIWYIQLIDCTTHAILTRKEAVETPITVRLARWFMFRAGSWSGLRLLSHKCHMPPTSPSLWVVMAGVIKYPYFLVMVSFRCKQGVTSV